MWSSIWLLSLLSLSVVAQTPNSPLQFGPNEFPTCASGCQNLQQAQDACVAAPDLRVCFCHSAYLTIQNNLAQSGAGVCPGCTSASDEQQLSTYFNSYCSGNSPAAAPTSTSTAPPGATSTSPSSGAAATSRPSSKSSSRPTWWDTHAKWIAMVIVLIVGFSIIIVVGIWLKRRHDRRTNRATMAPLPAQWGPNADPHVYPASSSEKHASAAAVETPQTPSLMESGRGSRLKKLVPIK